MANKNKYLKNQEAMPERNREENVRKERSSKRDMENVSLNSDKDRSMDENTTRRGYYSRNGGYNGYRGL